MSLYVSRNAKSTGVGVLCFLRVLDQQIPFVPYTHHFKLSKSKLFNLKISGVLL